MVANADPVAGGGAVVVGDQHRVAAGRPGVPGPGRVRESPLIRPGQELIDPAGGAIVLAQLGGHDRHLGGLHRGDGGVPARRIAPPGLGIVDVPAGRGLAQRILRPVVDPLRDVAAPAVGADGDDIPRAGGTDRVQQGLHARRLPGSGAIAHGAAMQPAIPADVVRLVEEIEDDAGVVSEEGRDRAPVRRRMVEVCHVAPLTGLAVGRQRSLGVPVQVDDGIHAGRVQPADIAGDRIPVIGAAIGRGGAVDAEPAIFVQRHPHRVDVPARHRRDRGRIARPIEEAVVGHALILGAGPVHAQQPDGPTAAVDEMIAGDPHRQASRLAVDGSVADEAGETERDAGRQQERGPGWPESDPHRLTGMLHRHHPSRRLGRRMSLSVNIVMVARLAAPSRIAPRIVASSGANACSGVSTRVAGRSRDRTARWSR